MGSFHVFAYYVVVCDVHISFVCRDEKIDDFSKTLLDYIKAHGGRINLNDKSPAEDIYDTFGVSKKTFKKGVGDLYKKRLITLHEDGIALADS